MLHVCVLAFAVTPQVLWARKRGPTYVTHVGCGRKRGWIGIPRHGRQRGGTHGGVRILGVGNRSPGRWVRISILGGGEVRIGLRWDNRLSIFYRAVTLKVGWNSGVQNHPRVVMRTGRNVLRGILRIHKRPCLWLLGDRDARKCRRVG